jgi:hypothetical protein
VRLALSQFAEAWPVGEYVKGQPEKPRSAEETRAQPRTSGQIQIQIQMKILCHIDRTECFRRGIDVQSSTIKFDINPAKLPQDLREFIADNLLNAYELRNVLLRSPDLIGFFEAVVLEQEHRRNNTTGAIEFSEFFEQMPDEKKAELARRVKDLVEEQGEDRQRGQEQADAPQDRRLGRAIGTRAAHQRWAQAQADDESRLKEGL